MNKFLVHHLRPELGSLVLFSRWVIDGWNCILSVPWYDSIIMFPRVHCQYIYIYINEG